MTEQQKAYRRGRYAAHREECLAAQRAYDAAHKAERKAYQASHRAEYRVYNRTYYLAHVEECRVRNLAYATAHPKEVATRLLAWRAANPGARDAHKQIEQAVHAGRLVRQPCAVCGATPAQGHHPSYADPLVITWLCARHHKQLHATIRLQQTAEKQIISRAKNYS